MANMCEGGRERDCRDPVVEYCDSRFLEACDIGRGRIDLLFGFWGEVMSGGSGGWLGLIPGDETGGGEVAGDEVGDITSVIFIAWKGSCDRNNLCTSVQGLSSVLVCPRLGCFWSTALPVSNGFPPVQLNNGL